MGNSYKVGDRVRVTAVREGKVTEVGRDWMFVSPTDGRDSFSFTAKYALCDIERLPDPEPEWQPGDVVKIAAHDTVVYMRGEDGWWRRPTGKGSVNDHFISGFVDAGLTHLVRDGKPVP